MEIWDWNVDEYGEAHADDYRAKLLSHIDLLVEDQSLLYITRDRGGIARTTFRTRKGAYGYVILFRESASEIEVVRILHTARNWQDLQDTNPD